MNSETSCQVKAARNKRPYVVESHLYEMSETGKSIEMESGLVVVRGWGEGMWVSAHGDGISFWGDMFLARKVMAVQHSECAKCYWIVHFIFIYLFSFELFTLKWWILCNLNFTSVSNKKFGVIFMEAGKEGVAISANIS